MSLSPEQLYTAYCNGFFPMPDSDTGEILWFRPDPRAIIPLDKFHTSRSLQKVLNRQIFQISVDRCFDNVMKACAARQETWITKEFLEIYGNLHKLGIAHSLEVWLGQDLVGGTYGVSIGGAFFAESMFHRVSNASKVAIFYLVKRLKERGFSLLECQFLTNHLSSLGAIQIPDASYIKRLESAIKLKTSFT